MAEAAQPGQKLIFERVGKFEEFLAREDVFDFLENFHEIERETF